MKTAVLAFVGLAAILAGLVMIYPPAALIAGGAVLLRVAAVTEGSR
jgi:hypothetical protein